MSEPDLPESLRTVADDEGAGDPRALAGDLERVLWVLMAADEYLSIPMLTPHNIEVVLREAYRLNVPRQRVQSLLVGNPILALRRKKAGRWHFQILDQGARLVRATNYTDVLLVEPANALTGIRQLQDILSSLNGQVLLCDPYLAPRSLDFMASLACADSLRILTQNVDKEPTVRRDLQALAVELDISIETRRPQERLLHDRYVIDDSSILMLGTSLNGLGKKQSMIVALGEDMRLVMTDAFSRMWTAGTPI